VTRGAGRRVVVLGDMLELGDHAGSAHEEVARVIVELGAPDLLVTVGPNALVIADCVTRADSRSRVVILSDMDDAQATRVAQRVQRGDAVLLKGSRRMGLERIERAIRRTAEPGSTGPFGSADPPPPHLSIAG